MNSYEMIKLSSEQPGSLMKTAATRWKEELAKKTTGMLDPRKAMRAVTPSSGKVVTEEAQRYGRSAGNIKEQFGSAQSGAVMTPESVARARQTLNAQRGDKNRLMEQVNTEHNLARKNAPRSFLGLGPKKNVGTFDQAMTRRVNESGGMRGALYGSHQGALPEAGEISAMGRRVGPQAAAPAAGEAAAAPAGGGTFANLRQRAGQAWNEHIKPNWKPIAGAGAAGLLAGSVASRNPQPRPAYGY